MGNIVQKGKVHPEEIKMLLQHKQLIMIMFREITEILLESLMFPVTPSEDIAGKYIWV